MPFGLALIVTRFRLMGLNIETELYLDRYWLMKLLWSRGLLQMDIEEKLN